MKSLNIFFETSKSNGIFDTFKINLSLIFLKLNVTFEPSSFKTSILKSGDGKLILSLLKISLKERDISLFIKKSTFSSSCFSSRLLTINLSIFFSLSFSLLIEKESNDIFFISSFLNPKKFF